MMKVQEYLRQSSSSLETLSNRFGVKANVHPELPLVILNYDQIDSSKTEPIAQECRALVLEKDSWNLVARSFSRFFNLGEMLEETKLFNWSDFVTHSKEDGSLIVVYNYRGRWYANTRGSWGLDVINKSTKTWKELIQKALGVSDLQDLKLDPNITYICELVSPHNQVVRFYPETQLYLLTAFEGYKELPDDFSDSVGLLRPQKYSFSSPEDIMGFLDENSKGNPTFEGVVIKDKSGLRIKCKSSTYVALHHMIGNGNVLNPKHHLPLVLKGEIDEVIACLPGFKEIYNSSKEIQEAFVNTKVKINEEFEKLKTLWEATWQIENQKEFALAVVKKTPFSNILFQLRKKKGNQQTLDELKGMWRQSEDLIVKVLF